MTETTKSMEPLFPTVKQTDAGELKRLKAFERISANRAQQKKEGRATKAPRLGIKVANDKVRIPKQTVFTDPTLGFGSFTEQLQSDQYGLEDATEEQRAQTGGKMSYQYQLKRKGDIEEKKREITRYINNVIDALNDWETLEEYGKAALARYPKGGQISYRTWVNRQIGYNQTAGSEIDQLYEACKTGSIHTPIVALLYDVFDKIAAASDGKKIQVKKSRHITGAVNRYFLLAMAPDAATVAQEVAFVHACGITIVGGMTATEVGHINSAFMEIMPKFSLETLSAFIAYVAESASIRADVKASVKQAQQFAALSGKTAEGREAYQKFLVDKGLTTYEKGAKQSSHMLRLEPLETMQMLRKLDSSFPQEKVESNPGFQKPDQVTEEHKQLEAIQSLQGAKDEATQAVENSQRLANQMTMRLMDPKYNAYPMLGKAAQDLGPYIGTIPSLQGRSHAERMQLIQSTPAPLELLSQIPPIGTNQDAETAREWVVRTVNNAEGLVAGKYGNFGRAAGMFGSAAPMF
jgi:hypothetical protein